MKWREADPRGVHHEVDADPYRVVFWDLGTGHSHAYDVTGAHHVSEVLGWARAQITTGGLHPGCYPEIGVLW